jgi:hypothetical protein
MEHLIACGEPLSFSYPFPAPIARPNEPVCRRVLLRNRKHGVLFRRRHQTSPVPTPMRIRPHDIIFGMSNHRTVFLLLNLALAFYNVGTIWAHEIDIFRSWKLLEHGSLFNAFIGVSWFTGFSFRLASR